MALFILVKTTTLFSLLTLQPARRRLVLAGIVLVIVQVSLLAKLPGASCLFVSSSIDEVSAPPSHQFRVGDLVWNVDEIAATTALAPFRAEFNAHCRGLRGASAATCVSRRMAAAFPWGVDAKSDVFSRRFDPNLQLAASLAGEPGHCVQRSGIMAAELLSMGIPARMAQIVTSDGGGHTLVEVWDAALGWVLVDPSYGGILGKSSQPLSVAAILAGAAIEIAPAHPPLSPERFYDRVSRSEATFLYPSPWLYLRTAAPAAAWPFHAKIARVGPAWFKHGGAQAALQVSSALTLALVALLLIGPLFALARRRRTRRAPATMSSSTCFSSDNEPFLPAAQLDAGPACPPPGA